MVLPHTQFLPAFGRNILPWLCRRKQAGAHVQYSGWSPGSSWPLRACQSSEKLRHKEWRRWNFRKLISSLYQHCLFSFFLGIGPVAAPRLPEGSLGKVFYAVHHKGFLSQKGNPELIKVVRIFDLEGEVWHCPWPQKVWILVNKWNLKRFSLPWLTNELDKMLQMFISWFWHTVLQ